MIIITECEFGNKLKTYVNLSPKTFYKKNSVNIIM